MVLDYCDAFDGRIATLQLDFEKDFDRVKYEILFSIIDHLNVGQVILQGVNMVYSE